nr:hypothetical protein [uncultured Butyrivibrio sp.]
MGYLYKKDVYAMLEENGYTPYWSKKNGSVFGGKTLDKIRNQENINLKTMALCAGLLGCHIGDLWDVDPADEELKQIMTLDHPVSENKRTGRPVGIPNGSKSKKVKE